MGTQQEFSNGIHFDLGQQTITALAAENLTLNEVGDSLEKHSLGETGDWEEATEFRLKMNQDAFHMEGEMVSRWQSGNFLIYYILTNLATGSTEIFLSGE